MPIGNAMRRLIPPGSYILLLFFLAGIWVAISPFVMTTQPSGHHWIASTINNVVVGAILMGVSLAGILGYLAFALQDLLREAQARQSVSEQVHQPSIEQ